MKYKISEVILWSNGIVNVLGSDGELIGELQGAFLAKRKEVKKYVTDETIFYTGTWGDGHTIGHTKIPKEHFFCEVWEETK